MFTPEYFRSKPERFAFSCRYWTEFAYPNFSPDAAAAGPTEAGRFSKNWIKLQAWLLDEFDAIIMMDTDLEVSTFLPFIHSMNLWDFVMPA